MPEEPKRTRGSWKILSGIRRLCACSQCGSSLAEAEEERRASSPRRWTRFSLKKRKKNSAEKQEEPEEEKPPESPDKDQLDLTGEDTTHPVRGEHVRDTDPSHCTSLEH